jgi:DinB family protein
MRELRIFFFLLTISFAAGMVAQSAAPSQGQPATPAPAAPKPTAPPTVAAVINTEVNIIEREFVSAAEAMPEEKYNFAPSGLNIAGSEFNGVRTFAEQVKHVASSNYEFWGPITGDKSPLPADSPNDNGPSALKTKAEIVKYLKDSFALGHKAAQSLGTPDAAMAMVPSPFGPGQQVTKLFMATFGVAHCFDHYGQMVEYLRMNGIVPPASRR